MTTDQGNQELNNEVLDDVVCDSSEEVKRDQTKLKGLFGCLKAKAVMTLQWLMNLSARCISKVKRANSILLSKLKSLYVSKPSVFIASSCACVVVIVSVFIFVVSYTSSQSPSAVPSHGNIKQNELLNIQNQSSQIKKRQRLQSLEKQVASMRTRLSESNASNQKFMDIQQQLTRLSQGISKAQSSAEEARIAAQRSAETVKGSTSERKAQTLKIEEQINSIHKQLNPQKYLAPNVLPFEVVSSGYWGKELLLTIAIKDVNGGFHYRLIGKNQELRCESYRWKIAGCVSWKLKSILSDPKEAIFIDISNPKKLVRVGL